HLHHFLHSGVSGPDQIAYDSDQTKLHKSQFHTPSFTDQVSLHRLLHSSVSGPGQTLYNSDQTKLHRSQLHIPSFTPLSFPLRVDRATPSPLDLSLLKLRRSQLRLAVL
ncbi:unnamed protein product, partial [Ilex paraguariensis]